MTPPVDPKKNEALLITYLKEIQSQPHLVTIPSLLLRLQYVELLHADSDVVYRLHDEQKEAEAVDAFHASREMLSMHKQMLAYDRSLIVRIEKLNVDQETVI
jgi:hypothetical protein